MSISDLVIQVNRKISNSLGIYAKDDLPRSIACRKPPGDSSSDSRQRDVPSSVLVKTSLWSLLERKQIFVPSVSSLLCFFAKLTVTSYY